MSKIAVDVTPLLPGGINGGAKPMVVALLQELPRLMADDEFILWTADYSHDELAFLDRPNLKRVCVHFSNTHDPEKQSAGVNLIVRRVWQLAKRWLPQRIQYMLRALYYGHRTTVFAATSFHKDQQLDFLFCPFGAPTFYSPNVPAMSVIYDLQFLDYPDFFTEQERFYRRLHFDQTCKLADHIATISEFTRQSVIKYSDVSPEQVTTIHIGLVHDYSNTFNQEEAQFFFNRLGLTPYHYLFYPANFWVHKNHVNLLEAFQLFRQKYPESDLKIVFTGALDDRRANLFARVEKMGLQQHIVAPGFLPDHEIGALYRSAKGLIFPSFYEGFGIPLLEAMQSGVPVACSNVTSLPEIGGDAVLYFNPENILEISQAIEALEFNDKLRNNLIQKGYKRLQHFGDARTMAQNYANLIRRTINKEKKTNNYALHGLTEDKWFQENAYLVLPSASESRVLEFSLHTPEWAPGTVEIIFTEPDNRISKLYCDHGGTLRESRALPTSNCIIEIQLSPAPAPASLGISSDYRPLSVFCEYFRIKSYNGTLLYDGCSDSSIKPGVS